VANQSTIISSDMWSVVGCASAVVTGRVTPHQVVQPGQRLRRDFSGGIVVGSTDSARNSPAPNNESARRSSGPGAPPVDVFSGVVHDGLEALISRHPVTVGGGQLAR
jgi:hypothetical protein